jgi:GGDEF domain-containing protein
VVVSINAAWRRYTLENGGTPTAGLGTNYLDIGDTAATDGEPDASEAAELVRLALQGVQPDRTVCYECSDGRWFRLQTVPIPGRHSGALVVHTDITAETHDVRRWQHQALHDPLTGLPNRALLQDRLAHAVAGAARAPDSVAVLFVDLDAFKAVNDTYGHAAGDRVLTEAADRMAASVRVGDTFGRWGATSSSSSPSGSKTPTQPLSWPTGSRPASRRQSTSAPSRSR